MHDRYKNYTRAQLCGAIDDLRKMNRVRARALTGIQADIEAVIRQGIVSESLMINGVKDLAKTSATVDCIAGRTTPNGRLYELVVKVKEDRPDLFIDPIDPKEVDE